MKLLAKLRRPVLPADFVAVNEDVVERLALSGKRTKIINHLLDEAGPVRVEGFGAEFVALRPGTFRRRGMILAARGRVADAKNRPLTGGRVPIQMTTRIHPAREIHRLVALHHQTCLGGTFHDRRRNERAVVAVLGLHVFNAQARA